MEEIENELWTSSDILGLRAMAMLPGMAANYKEVPDQVGCARTRCARKAMNGH